MQHKIIHLIWANHSSSIVLIGWFCLKVLNLALCRLILEAAKRKSFDNAVHPFSWTTLFRMLWQTEARRRNLANTELDQALLHLLSENLPSIPVVECKVCIEYNIYVFWYRLCHYDLLFSNSFAIRIDIGLLRGMPIICMFVWFKVINIEFIIMICCFSHSFAIRIDICSPRGVPINLSMHTLKWIYKNWCNCARNWKNSVSLQRHACVTYRKQYPS